MVKKLIKNILISLVRPVFNELLLRNYRVFGNPHNLTIADTAKPFNTLFNTVSGKIYVGEFAFFGHNVVVTTGTHNWHYLNEERQKAIPAKKNDVFIGEGVWIGTGAIILGPCRIGKHAVVAAGAVVTHDVPELSIVAGVPARVIRHIGDDMGTSIA